MTEETFDQIVARLKAGDPELLAGVRDEMAKLVVAKNPPNTFPRGWYIIRVELASGRADEFELPPGRDFLISPQHTFRQFAEAINAAFARWDLGHLYAFEMADGTRLVTEWDELALDTDPPPRLVARTKLGRRRVGEVFEYEFDFGDGWMHRCTVTEADVEPDDEYGRRPKGPVAVWGWGSIPDQYGRTRPDGEQEEPE